MKFFTESEIEKIRNGYYSAVYFNRTKEILQKEKILTPVTMQVFQRKEGAFLCGIQEVKEMFENVLSTQEQSHITLESLNDGAILSAKQPVLHIKGPYQYFAHLESVYLGILARRTLVATNTYRSVKEAKGKSVFFFADRFDYFLNQEGDGYAAHMAGASGVCTEAHAKIWNGQPLGTIPHALIASFNGDAVAAAKAFLTYYPNVPLIVLVDFENDCVRTALQVARELKEKLYAIRIDTSFDMVDKSFESQKAKVKSQKLENRGVNPDLVKNVRNALDNEGFRQVKIAVSGGFNPEKIKLFESKNTPVDIYGVGSHLIHGENDFTADIVEVNGKKMAKEGRVLSPISF